MTFAINPHLHRGVKGYKGITNVPMEVKKGRKGVEVTCIKGVGGVEREVGEGGAGGTVV